MARGHSRTGGVILTVWPSFPAIDAARAARGICKWRGESTCTTSTAQLAGYIRAQAAARHRRIDVRRRVRADWRAVGRVARGRGGILELVPASPVTTMLIA